MRGRQRPDSGTEARGRCLSLEELLEVVRARRLGSGADALRHVDQCSACGAARSWLEGVLEATAAGPLEEPPASVTERAIQVFAREPVEERRHSWSLARLVFDSLAAPLPAGVRGRGAGRRLLYDAGWADLDVEIREAPLDPEAFRVMGQLLAKGSFQPRDVIVVLWSEETVAVRAVGDPAGLFVLPEVRPGTYRLEIWALAQDGESGGMTVEPFELKGEG